MRYLAAFLAGVVAGWFLAILFADDPFESGLNA